MKISIHDKIGKLNPEKPDLSKAKEYLGANKAKFPAFTILTENFYKGVRIEVDDDDVEDFSDAIEASGFDYAVDDAEDESNKPIWPKFKPKLEKSKPVLSKSRPVLPRSRVVPRPKPF